MASVPRYEILDTLAVGDFATVYRARDRELGREVAIKQIHQQFLHNERQLARYWQEAQLLASLQHPHILTIYDIVRSRGWLIVELMRGNLQQFAHGDPIDLDYLRVAMVGCLGALDFLHRNGIVHGDVKPSNMLIDQQNRVKLGDFGLARRASNEEGSLLKGTTKYMAPELMSNQFGAVGPASDLYSLGFSAYDLMCGSQFEALFPGLSAFGRDKQIAWMMWHAAADRHVPEIGRVLEGVPPDLARVVQKLTVKDQSRRYQSARDVLRDLQTPSMLAAPGPAEDDAASMAVKVAAAKKKQRLRFVAVGALVLSAVLSLAIFLPKKESSQTIGPPEPIRGVLKQVFPQEFRLAILTDENKNKEVQFTLHTRFFVNDEPCTALSLKLDDRLTIERIEDKSGDKATEVRATRPDVHKGRIVKVEADKGQFLLRIEEGKKRDKDEILIVVPNELKIVFNGKDQLKGEAVTLDDLQEGDRVEVYHVGEETGRRATALSSLRVVATEGIIRDLDKKKGRLTLEVGTAEKSENLVLPFAAECEVTVNNLRTINDKLLKPADLLPGDKATVSHDTQIVRVNALRALGQAGVIRKVQHAARTLDVVMEGSDKTTTFAVGASCVLTLSGETVALSDLRDGDTVKITHDNPDTANPGVVNARIVAAERAADPARWALLIAGKDYDDKSLSKLEYSVEDAKLLQDVLVKRYQVPSGQVQLLADESLISLKQTIPDRLQKPPAEGMMIVYVGGHAYKDAAGQVYLAPKNFDLSAMSTTGLSLQWLVDLLEECPAKDKLLLLDCCNAGKGGDLAKEPSTAEMMDTLKAPPGRSPLRTVTAVVSCQAGQRGLVLPDKGHGLFAFSLSEGFSGRADKNLNNRIEPVALSEYLAEAMSAAGATVKGTQAPKLILPDARPPRLSEDAKKAIRGLAGYLRQEKPDPQAALAAYEEASEKAGKELEPKLLYGLFLLKVKKYDEGVKHFSEVRIEHPNLLLPLQGIVWARFEKRAYKTGVSDLQELIAKVPKPQQAGDPLSPEVQKILLWAGQIREYASVAVEKSWQPTAESLATLDAAVAAHSAEAERLYQKGRDHSRAVAAKFAKDIAAAEAVGNTAATAKLKVECRQLIRYADFPIDEPAQRILAGLDQ